jgi:NADPH2:quinone reductase
MVSLQNVQHFTAGVIGIILVHVSGDAGIKDGISYAVISLEGHSMKAIRIHEFGGPEGLKYEDVPEPTPKPNEAIVRVDAAGVNFIDIYQRTGVYKLQLPATLGLEGGGTVSAIGPEVKDVKVGDRVAWTSVPGAYAEYAAVPAERLVVLPASVTTKQGAAAMLQGLTAHYLSHSTFPLRAGDTCLVHAGAGGVGLLLTQIAKKLGARVITTVSTEEKAALSREAGADLVVLYSKQDFEAEVKAFTGGRGVPVVYDSVGQATIEKSINCLWARGMLVLFGQSSGVVPSVDPQHLSQKGSLFFTRPTLVHYIASRAELQQRTRDLFEWIGSGALRLRMEFEFPLKDVAEAHQALAGRKTTGKVLLVPG